MAAGGIFFATQQGDRAGLDLLLQPTYTIEERSGTSDQRVVYPALRIVEFPAFWPSAQLSAQEEVPDPFTRKGRFDAAGVELRRMPGVRVRTGVHQDLDPVPLQQAGEPLRRMVGMPDRENRSSTLRRPLIADG